MTFISTVRWNYLQRNCYTKRFLFGITTGQRQLRCTSHWNRNIYCCRKDHTILPFPALQNSRNKMSTKTFSTNAKDSSSFTLKLPLTRPIHYTEAPGRSTSIYPTAELAAMVQGRNKRAIGSLFGIKNFGMNITTLQPMEDTALNVTATATDDDASKPASSSSIVHYHTKQDEMIYIISGTATLLLYDPDTNTYEDILMTAGDVMGFPAGRTIGHSIRNMSTTESLTILEIGDRTKCDTAVYPEPSIDLFAEQLNDELNDTDKGNKYCFFHKNGRPY
jgi:uncharacterized cupin superfamily protein